MPTPGELTRRTTLTDKNGTAIDSSNRLPVDATVTGTVTVDTELPAATLIADNEALPTTTRVGAIMQGMDSSGANNVDVARLSKAHDLDTSGNTEFGVGVSMRVEASGGSIPQTYGAGVVAPGTQRVTHASDDPVTTALQIIDDWDESDRAKVNPIVGQAGVQGGAGASTANTQRVAIATDANAVDTELPAAAALSDNSANPTAPAVGAYLLGLDGATWDRITVEAAAAYLTGNSGTAKRLGVIALNAQRWSSDHPDTPSGTNEYFAQNMNDRGDLLASIGSLGNVALPTENSNPVIPNFTRDLTNSGNLTAVSQTVSIAMAGRNTAAFVLSGTWVATLTAEMSLDGGTTWVTAMFYQPALSISNAGTTATANGSYYILGTGGATHARVRVSAYTSGTIAVAARAVSGHIQFMVLAGQTVGTPGNFRPLLTTGDSSDANAAVSTNLLWNAGRNHVYNGSTWDRQRGTTTGTQSVGGLAHDAADTAANNPVKIGAQARTTNPTAVANADIVNAIADKLGRLVIAPHQVRELCADQITTITSTTAATTIVTAVASTFLDLIGLIITNTSATGTEVQILNDDGTTVRASFFCPATSTVSFPFPAPLKQTVVNNTWKAITVTSVASVKITAQFVHNV